MVFEKTWSYMQVHRSDQNDISTWMQNIAEVSI